MSDSPSDSRPDPEPGSADGPATIEWRKASRFYRQPPGLGWLIGLMLIPLLLAVIGYGMVDRDRPQNGGEPEPRGALPTLVEPTVAGVPPGLALAPLSIARHGDEITLHGDLPDEAARRALLDSVIAAMGHDVNLIDNLGVRPGIRQLDFFAARPVFRAAAAVPDFSLAVTGDTVTLTGTAATGGEQNTIADAALAAWPNVNIVNEMNTSGPLTPNTTPVPGPPRAPGN